ncbi:lysoplasmalogenase [Streptomyces heilongjiangensis]|uniref:Lysoplasmalogenase n=1 Tax=Streptomyces heilongjiangensis TaxID=945052 RepID=A0ABW1B1V8_9ACTN|nr:lysoplasmalogenase [Streptomyces heilongjiangensis]MDC2950906.1 lysoplasmalogenase [Streptomyces heilongjiangensis]
MRGPGGRTALVALGLATAVDLGSLAAGFTPGHVVAKPLLMPLLAAYVHARGGPRLLIAALLCGWGGDVLLLSDADPAFLAGMGCFAAGHVCYLVLFGRRARRPGVAHDTLDAGARPAGERGARARALRLPAAYALALVVAVASLWPGLPADLRLPVAGYSALLTAMACSAARLGAVAGAGGALFVLSDMLIATGVAQWPQLPRPDLWIMLTYIAAQYLLARGVLRTLEAGTPAPTGGPVPATS